MAKEKKKKRPWIQNFLNRYRMVIINETTFEEKFFLRISQFNIIVLVLLFAAFIAIGSFFLVSYTPLKEFIPGYTSLSIRKEAIRNTFLLDSLSIEFQKQDRFIQSIKSALTGEIDWEENSLLNAKDTSPEVLNSENTLTEADSLLRLEVIQEDKYNVIPNDLSNVKYLLYSPAAGPISQKYDADKKHFAVDIVLEENAPVMAVAHGTVIFAEWTAETGHVIIVKHDYGLLSVYKHNSYLEKSQGDLVKAGEVIAKAGNTGEFSTGWHLHFELWINGYSVDPTDFIEF
ncbi:MAG: peptidoglycan DD-metalloendopeptidase family protein [Bacteroidetes bacterium]|jgi:murein DD-endopeptidase MepM/ murein hydrolase activator NlpD|nr:M23 family metallopeptidase [Flavobacteriaceae bacterium]NCF31656.1 peptidoglycan DD-metalloendopeptidase family protein [Bacteroidota bacterium]